MIKFFISNIEIVIMRLLYIISRTESKKEKTHQIPNKNLMLLLQNINLKKSVSLF